MMKNIKMLQTFSEEIFQIIEDLNINKNKQIEFDYGPGNYYKQRTIFDVIITHFENEVTIKFSKEKAWAAVWIYMLEYNYNYGIVAFVKLNNKIITTETLDDFFNILDENNTLVITYPSREDASASCCIIYYEVNSSKHDLYYYELEREKLEEIDTKTIKKIFNYCIFDNIDEIRKFLRE
jgi:hypothetical protein